ncbi:MAG: hypothetical protein U1F57_06400 [bacterium]
MRGAILSFVFSLFAFLMCVFFLMTVFSSADLNFANCGNSFSWNSPDWICRQPLYFEGAALLMLLLSLALLGLGVWKAAKFKKQKEAV